MNNEVVPLPMIAMVRIEFSACGLNDYRVRGPVPSSRRFNLSCSWRVSL